MKQEVLNDLNSASGKASSSLWKYKPCPFVYLYDKIANLDLCIDSRYVEKGGREEFICDHSFTGVMET